MCSLPLSRKPTTNKGAAVSRNLLDQIPLFAGLAPGEKEALRAGLVENQVAQGTTLLRSGETGNALYLIVQGFVSLATAEGRSLATLGPGSVVGEMALFRGAPSDVTVTALSALETLELSDGRVREILFRHPALALRLRAKLGGLPVQMNDYLLRRMEGAAGFAGLPAQALHAISAKMDLHELRVNEPIQRMGKLPSGLFLLESGEIMLEAGKGTAAAHRGAPWARRVLPGDLMGVLSLLTGKPSTTNGTAVQDCLVWLLPVQEFHTLAGQFPALRRTLARGESAPLGEGDQVVAQSLLARTPLFAALGAKALRELAAVMTLRHLAAGERIYTVGQSGDAFYFVEEGEVALAVESIGGEIEESARIGPKGCCGERGLLADQAYRENATAVRHTTLWVLSRADLDDLCARLPEIGKAIHEGASLYLASEKPDRTLDMLRGMALFADLAEPELQHVASYLRAQKVSGGTSIFAPGSPGDTVFLLRSGQVRIRPMTGTDRFVGPGEAFGESVLLHSGPHDEGATAEIDSELWSLRQEDFARLASRYPGLAYNLTRLLSSRLALMAEEAQRVSEVEYAASQSGMRGQRFGRREGDSLSFAAGEWFARQTPFGKVRTGLLAFLLILGVGFGTLITAQALRGEGGSLASQLDVRNAIRAVHSMGSYELARQDKELALALAMADRMARPTSVPTLPPTATPTPLPTATPTNTPLPTATATATFTPQPIVRQFVQEAAPPPAPEPQAVAAAAPPRAWDPRLTQLGVVVEDAPVSSGQQYWRLVEAIWWDEQQSGGKHHIYVEVLDENGNRVVGQPVTAYWADGTFTAPTEDKNPPDYAFNYQMYATGNAYHVKIEGLPSETVRGVGMGSLELPRWAIHTSFLLTFQRTTKP